MESDALRRLVFLAVPIGLIAAWIMNRLMWLISQHREVPVKMANALGSLILRRESGAAVVGNAIHLLAGAFFATIYLGLIQITGLTLLHQSFLLGLGFGLFHGVIVTIGLMIVVDEMHPIPRYRHATLPIGIVHLFGHIVFGGIVGLLGGFLI